MKLNKANITLCCLIDDLFYTYLEIMNYPKHYCSNLKSYHPDFILIFKNTFCFMSKTRYW